MLKTAREQLARVVFFPPTLWVPGTKLSCFTVELSHGHMLMDIIVFFFKTGFLLYSVTVGGGGCEKALKISNMPGGGSTHL